MTERDAMFRWFSKKAPPQPPETVAHEGPTGEVEKVQRIRLLCESGKWSARNLAGDGTSEEMREYERSVYTKRKEAALELARELTDEFYRDAALHSIIELCVEGREIAYARELLEVVEVDIIRDEILKAYPQLGTKF